MRVMLSFPLEPSGHFEAKAETIGTDLDEMTMFSQISVLSDEQSRRFVTIQENLRHAFETLAAAAPANAAPA